MRSNPTPAEAQLWQRLRCRRTLGLKFTRQALACGYIVDFYCPQLKLVVEVDGSFHSGREAYDRERDQRLTKAGLRVVRVTNEDVLNHRAQAMVARAAQELQRATNSPSVDSQSAHRP